LTIDYYLKIIKIISGSINKKHRFITISKVYYKLSKLLETFQKDVKSKNYQNRKNLILMYYTNSLNEFKNEFQYENYIKISDLTKRIYETIILFKISKINYYDNEYQDCRDKLLIVEKNLFELKNFNEKLNINFSDNLLHVHRILSIAYCKLNDYKNSKKWVKTPIVILNNNINKIETKLEKNNEVKENKEIEINKILNISEELRNKNMERKMIENELKKLHRGVVDQQNLLCYFSLSQIYFFQNNYNLFSNVIQLVLQIFKAGFIF
jgi:hypothetical protein